MESPIWTFAFGTLSVYPFFLLRHVPVMGRLKIPFWKLMIYASIIVLVQGFSYIWLSTLFPFGSPVLVWHRKLFMIFFILLTLIFSKDSPNKTLFMDFFMVGIVMAVIDFAYIIDRTWFAQAFAAAPMRTDVLVRGAITLLIYPPLYFLFKKCLRPVMTIESPAVWSYMTAIPFVFAIISIITTMEAFDHQISPIILSIRFCVIGGLVLVCVLLVNVVKQMEMAVIAQEKSKHSDQLVALQSYAYESIKSNIDESRRLRHDLRHHLSIVRQYVENAQYADLSNYLNEYLNSIPESDNIVVCENFAVNALTIHYMGVAKTNNVTFTCDLDIGSNLGIPDTDLCIIIGNLLENALEATMLLPQTQRFFNFKTRIIAGNLTILIENNFAPLDSNFATGLEEGAHSSHISELRGVGLISVKAALEQLGGSLINEQRNNRFITKVIIPIHLSV